MMDIPTDLAGDITIQMSDQHADFFTRNLVAVVAEQDLSTRWQPNVRRAAWVAAPRQLIADTAALDALQTELFDRLRPWIRADPNPFPQLIPFRSVHRLGRAVGRARAAISERFDT